MKTYIAFVMALFSAQVFGGDAQYAIDRYLDQGQYGRVEVVPAQPRPLTEPLTGVKPVWTFGTSEHYLPDPEKARLDAVSTGSREHLETMIRDFKKR